MKLVLDQVNHGLIARGLGQAWFAPAPRSLHISKVVRGQVLANIVQPVHHAIDDSIRDPLLGAIRAEIGWVRHGRIEVLAKPQSKLAQRPPSRGRQSDKICIDLVDQPRDTRPACQQYLKTCEAAAYLRRSVSWLLRCGEIPYVPGRPNLYSVKDLGDWFERNKHIPRS
jgi:hypothetical protein